MKPDSIVDDPLETKPFGNIDWLMRESGWTADKISRLSRLGLIPGARQAQPGVQGSPWSYRKARTLRWLRSLET
jgi:hypothetical protein